MKEAVVNRKQSLLFFCSAHQVQVDGTMDIAANEEEAESGSCSGRQTSSSVIVTSISSPSILHSPPASHGSLRSAKTFCPLGKEPLDLVRLESTALP